MGRAQFEYDEVGHTSYYVVLSFFTVIIFPLTYYLWPSAPKENDVSEIGCQCAGCAAKRNRKRAIQPREYKKRFAKLVVVVLIWALYLFIATKVSQIEHVSEEYDPYQILGIDRGADMAEIKKKYRDLSKVHHPDRGGDEEKFNFIAKAYQALTNEESRQNWEKYGNPDGPKATTFGIGLPKWIVSDQYGNFVLAIYLILIMLLLPTVVYIWWSSSMKYSSDQVLLETTRSFYEMLMKTPSMNMYRAITVLSGVFEFCKKFNPVIEERDSDEFEVKRLIKDCKNIGETKKEIPFYLPWSIKARVLLQAHLGRLPLLSERLEEDQFYYLTRISGLIEEFTRMHLQLYFHFSVQRPPTLESLEMLLKLQPMFVQGLWPNMSTILQLPHIQENQIAFLRRKRVYNCADLANLNEFRRRALLNLLDDSQYEDVVCVLNQMPKLEVESVVEVQGEVDKHTVTAGSVVTVKVILKRSPLLDLKKRNQELAEGPKIVKEEKEEEEPQKQRKVWEKPQKKKGKAGKKKAQPKKKAAPATAKANDDEETKPLVENGNDETNDETESEGDSDIESDSASIVDDDQANGTAASNHDSASDEENDDMWNDGMARKESILDREPTDHHPVHCPYYPLDKFEWWYLYMVDKKSKRMATYLMACKSLKDEKTIELRFSAPPQKGQYSYTLYVRSDSYMDADYSSEIKLDVHEARVVEPVQYDFDEEDETAEGNLSEYTEGSDSDESDD